MEEIVFKTTANIDNTGEESYYSVKSNDTKSVIKCEGRVFAELRNNGDCYEVDFHEDCGILELDFCHMEYLWMLYEVMMKRDNHIIEKFKRIE